jgi:autotransporter passenger strand-loop-strand repeat protein
VLYDTAALPTNVISGLAPGDSIDLPVGFDSGGSANVLSGNVLQVVDNGISYDLQLDPLQDFSKDVFQPLPADGTTVVLEQFSIVSSGQVDSGAILSAGNLQYVSGTSISAIIGGGVQNVYGIASATRILSSSFQEIYSGGATTDVMIEGGEQDMFGTATNTTIDGGLQVIYASGLAAGATISGGEQLVYGTASGTVIGSGGSEFIYGNDSGAVIGGGGYQAVEGGGTAFSATINSGGDQDDS